MMSETAVKMGGETGKHITFIAPDGVDRIAPSPEELRELVLNRGDDYWQADAGDAAIWYDREDGSRSRLILVEDERHGFFLLYEAPDGDGGYLCPVEEQATDETVTVYTGGEPMEVEARRFVSKEKAWEAVEYFLQTGEANPKLNWEAW
jgi:hypothetical protein